MVSFTLLQLITCKLLRLLAINIRINIGAHYMLVEQAGVWYICNSVVIHWNEPVTTVNEASL